MRILKILRGNDAGGILTCEIQYIKHWKGNNIKVDGIIVGQGEAVLEYKNVLDNVYEVPENNYSYNGSFFNIINSIIQTRQYAKALTKTLRIKNEYDAIIYRRATFIHIAGLFGKKERTKVIWHLPNSVNQLFGKMYYNFYLKKYSIIPVANSVYTKKSLGKICNHVIYPGFDESRIDLTSNTYRTDLNIPQEAFVFGTASRITYSKAQDLLLEGLVKSGLLDKNVHCIIAGDVQDENYEIKLKEISKNYHSKIHFIGKIKDMSKFYSSLDIYVNSRRNEESFGISIAEAMAAGLPVIAYYKGGPSEMIKNKVNGWLIDEPSIDSYTKTFLEAFEHRSKWQQMGIESKKKSFMFQASYNADKLISLL